MKLTQTAIPGVLVSTPVLHRDSRGYFFEERQTRDFTEVTGGISFVQSNVSVSSPWVLRGIHYQLVNPMGKLLRCLRGEAYVVAIDLRKSSPTFKQYVGKFLDDASHEALYMPPGFGAGFLSLSHGAMIHYDVTAYFVGEYDRAVKWDDPELEINWPLSPPGKPFMRIDPIVSQKDRGAPSLQNAEIYK